MSGRFKNFKKKGKASLGTDIGKDIQQAQAFLDEVRILFLHYSRRISLIPADMPLDIHICLFNGFYSFLL
jgi:hypothetical protein